MSRLVVFDMDGVLADVESSWVYVHKTFGVNNDHSLRAYLRGEISDLEFIRRDIKLWKDKEPEVNANKIRNILSEIPLMPGASETLRSLRQDGYRTAIVSAGIDILADMIAEMISIDIHLANGMVTDRLGRLTGEGVLRVRLADKGDAVDQVARQLGASKQETTSVGNSRYDISMFDRSHLGIAFCPADDVVGEKAGAVVDRKDLREILKFIQ